jgi:hypothetical protein
MRRGTRRLLVGITVVGVLFACIYLVRSLTYATGVTFDSVDRIERGMTPDEAEAIIGEKPTEVRPMETVVGKGTEMRWKGDQCVIRVGIIDGRVEYAESIPPAPVRPSWIKRFWRRIGF